MPSTLFFGGPLDETFRDIPDGCRDWCVREDEPPHPVVRYVARRYVIDGTPIVVMVDDSVPVPKWPQIDRILRDAR